MPVVRIAAKNSRWRVTDTGPSARALTSWARCERHLLATLVVIYHVKEPVKSFQ